jgi:hypothetical protein
LARRRWLQPCNDAPPAAGGGGIVSSPRFSSPTEGRAAGAILVRAVSDDFLSTYKLLPLDAEDAEEAEDAEDAEDAEEALLEALPFAP